MTPRPEKWFAHGGRPYSVGTMVDPTGLRADVVRDWDGNVVWPVADVPDALAGVVHAAAAAKQVTPAVCVVDAHMTKRVDRPLPESLSESTVTDRIDEYHAVTRAAADLIVDVLCAQAVEDGKPFRTDADPVHDLDAGMDFMRVRPPVPPASEAPYSYRTRRIYVCPSRKRAWLTSLLSR